MGRRLGHPIGQEFPNHTLPAHPSAIRAAPSSLHVLIRVPGRLEQVVKPRGNGSSIIGTDAAWKLLLPLADLLHDRFERDLCRNDMAIVKQHQMGIVSCQEQDFVERLR